MELIKNLVRPTTFKRWHVQNLDYNWYFALAVGGGLFGLDYLYLGSPLGAFAKMLFNFSTFGYWWFHDALNAVVGQDQIRLYGPTAPVLGALGVGAARFRDADPTKVSTDPALKKHLNFLIYGLVLGFAGMFGGDSFLTGHFFNGVIRLICLVSMIGAPIAIFWWVKNLYYYIFDTSTCINQNYAYFGAAKGTGPDCPSFFASFTIFLLQTASGIVGIIPGAGPLIKLILDKLIKSLMEAYDMVTVDAEAAEIGFDRLAAHAGNPPMDVKELQKTKIDLELKPHDKDCNANLEPLTPEEEAAHRASLGTATATATLQSQGGGALLEGSPYLPLFLSMTIGLVVVSSIVISLRRLRQNAKPDQSNQSKAVKQHGSEETDDPPQPGHTRGPTPV